MTKAVAVNPPSVLEWETLHFIAYKLYFSFICMSSPLKKKKKTPNSHQKLRDIGIAKKTCIKRDILVLIFCVERLWAGVHTSDLVTNCKIEDWRFWIERQLKHWLSSKGIYSNLKSLFIRHSPFIQTCYVKYIYVQNTFNFTFLTSLIRTTKAMYSIIQDNSIHKRLDCVNIVLGFFYQIHKNKCQSQMTNITITLMT